MLYLNTTYNKHSSRTQLPQHNKLADITSNRQLQFSHTHIYKISFLTSPVIANHCKLYQMLTEEQ